MTAAGFSSRFHLFGHGEDVTDNQESTVEQLHLRVLPVDGATYVLQMRVKDENILDDQTFQIQKFLKYVSDTFSPKSATSLLSRYNGGDDSGLSENSDFLQVVSKCVDAHRVTEGYFQPFREGKLDPFGMLRGWAINEAFNRYVRPLVEKDIAQSASLGSKNDTIYATHKDFEINWNVPIKNSLDSSAPLQQVVLRNGAISTSFANMEVNFDYLGPRDCEQTTIVSPDLALADVWATAALAAGTNNFMNLAQRNKLNAIVLTDGESLFNVRDGQVSSVPGLLVGDPRPDFLVLNA
ncbi:MAG: hypothetical protein PUF97_03195 [Bifidobacteriaceae bacterium]|nr:hypothetical protein [Bifidobacteriaceae bacterium]